MSPLVKKKVPKPRNPLIFFTLTSLNNKHYTKLTRE